MIDGAADSLGCQRVRGVARSPTSPKMHVLALLSQLVLVVLAAGFACATQVRRPTPDAALTVASTVGAEVPAGTLAGVRLGMSFDTLRRVRPPAIAEPYVGAVERVNADTIRYRFSDRLYGELEDELRMADPSTGGAAPLRAVDVQRQYESTQAADSAWASRVRRWRESHPTATCGAFSQGDMTVNVLLTQEDGTVGGVMRYPARSLRDVRGIINLRAVVTTFIAEDITIYIPNPASLRRSACPGA